MRELLFDYFDICGCCCLIDSLHSSMHLVLESALINIIIIIIITIVIITIIIITIIFFLLIACANNRHQWVNVMRETMNIHIRWISIMHILVLDTHYKMHLGKRMVDYVSFLDSFSEEEDEMTAAGRRAELRANAASPSALKTIVEVNEAASEDNEELTPTRGAVCVAERYNECDVRGAEMVDSTTIESNSERISMNDFGEQKEAHSSSAAGDAATSHSSGSKSMTSRVAVGRSDDSTESAAAGRDAEDGAEQQMDEAPVEEYCGFAISEELMDTLYINFEQVERAFRYFDRNEDGFITKDEFRQACKEINLLLSPDLKIRDTEDILMLMDIEETGEIPFNIFFEMYRLSEMKLNVGIDEEDTLSTPVMVHSETKDLMRGASTASALQVSGKHHQLHLEIHGVEINIDTFLPAFDAQHTAREPSLEKLEAAGVDV